jgi:hypothetical protein
MTKPVLNHKHTHKHIHTYVNVYIYIKREREREREREKLGLARSIYVRCIVSSIFGREIGKITKYSVVYGA